MDMFPMDMRIHVLVFWVVTPCGDVVGYQRLSDPSNLLLQDDNEMKVEASWSF